MFALLRRPVRRAPASAVGSRPYLEALERRDCPTGPAISMTLTYGVTHNVNLTGTVTDSPAPPSGLAVQLGGVVIGQAVTDGAGHFTITLPASSVGTITATVTDALNQTASTSVAMSNAAPVISNFQATCGPDNFWTFTGQVSDEHAAGLIISFGNSAPASLQGQTCEVQANGTFTLTIQMQQNASDCGTAAAQIDADWWGLASNQATCNVQQSP